jgi:cell wall-associated NlpC family hydrolase
MGRLYDAYIEVGPRFAGFGDIKKQGDQAGKEYGKALAAAAVKAAQANARNLGAALAKARSAEADAAGKVRVAETQLGEARKKYGAASSQAVSAEERLAAAQRKSASAADTTKQATEALGKAQNQVAAAAADAGKRSGGRFSGAFKGALSKIGGEKEGRQVATRFGVGMNGAIGGIVSRSQGVFLAGFAAIKGAQVFSGFINDARESAKVARVSAQVVRSTGAAAKISAAQMGDLATAISNKTGADDEDVQSGENLLATFTNVRNEVGKNNDIFNRASQAAVDMASAMNNGVVDANGLKAANIQLGKALNDPVKGVTALSKVGVSFTRQQKDQIKTLVDSGKTLDAQKIILGEVGKEFGGAAAAAADPVSRLKVILGNLSEQVGGFLLPSVNKFVNFVTNTGIPGIQALFSAFQEGDVTSDGFVGVMERIGVTARGAFGFFKTEVLPRLQEFGSFLIGTAVPAVAGFGRNLVTSLGPAVKDVFGFFKTEVLPRLKDFAGFLGESVLPKVAAMATSLSKNKDFLVPFAGTIVAVVGGLKAWAIIQGVLNVVLAANPIGLVVVALAALVGGLVYAYKHSETFKNIVNAAFKVVAAAGQFMWNSFLKPMLGLLALTLEVVWKKAQFWSGVMIGAFNAIKGPAVSVLRFVVGQMLDFVGNMINAAAKAFGWVPKIGGPLKNAAAEFNKFRDKTNAALAGINDQTIKISPVVLAASAAHRNAVQDRIDRHATGGPIFGPGSGTSDSIPAMLSNGEHVWTAKEVQKAGGHGAVQQMRRSVMAYAKGGPVGLDVKGDFPYLGKSMASIASVAVAVARPIAQALGNAFAKINPGLEGVLKFVRSQVGKPYVWGGVGPGGYDCSGLVSAAINVARGNNPYRRLGATGSMPWSMFAPGPGAFEVGWFQGNPGHTAATVNGTNIESAGGVGVRMGSHARGARNPLFTNRAHVKGFAQGGQVGVYDRGGRWPSGTLGINTSGKTETVVPGDGVIRLHPDDLRQLAKLLSLVTINASSIDQAVSRRALSY